MIIRAAPEATTASALHPPQRAVALVADGSVLAKSNAPAGRTARALHGDRGQARPLHSIGSGFMGLFGHAAFRPVSPDVMGKMRNRWEFRGLFP